MEGGMGGSLSQAQQERPRRSGWVGRGGAHGCPSPSHGTIAASAPNAAAACCRRPRAPHLGAAASRSSAFAEHELFVLSLQALRPASDADAGWHAARPRRRRLRKHTRSCTGALARATCGTRRPRLPRLVRCRMLLHSRLEASRSSSRRSFCGCTTARAPRRRRGVGAARSRLLAAAAARQQRRLEAAPQPQRRAGAVRTFARQGDAHAAHAPDVDPPVSSSVAPLPRRRRPPCLSAPKPAAVLLETCFSGFS
jgi:hypothetical protein